jgi:hypothetical protein
MKLIAGIVTVALVACAASPSADESGPAARCSVTDCFNESAIRSFEVLNDRTAVVYVGPQRCPFVVNIDGFNCSLAVAPELKFLTPLYGSTRAAEATGQICGTRDTLYVYTGLLDPALAGDINAINSGSYDTLGRQRSTFGDRVGSSRTPTSGVTGVSIDTVNNADVCRVNNVHSITDDQLVELRVQQGAPPPPPIGQGKVEMPASQGPEGESSPGQGTEAAPPASQGTGGSAAAEGQSAASSSGSDQTASTPARR